MSGRHRTLNTRVLIWLSFMLVPVIAARPPVRRARRLWGRVAALRGRALVGA